ncbi:PucR family transcriptional regulator [Kitasatospora brasiliensis]|uniref:PucR family transcriptional regulator n=1 Tax=Kitasatospora brasiliensis TaxID=3058040 RepID=UPI00292F0FD6|nr:helix-turn-helix domain-containing protein [Kitasatospora sp. K002]
MTNWIQRARSGGEVLQTLVDGLAEELGRSVVLDDPLVRMICTSRHFGDEDRVRVRTLLQGIADDEAIRYVLSQGVGQWTGPGILPGRDDLGLRPRYCVPIRERGHMLGILMVLAVGDPLTEGEIAAIDRVARTVAAEMYADRLASDLDEKRNRQLLGWLVGSDSALRCAAHQRLVDDGLLPAGPHVVVTSVAVAGQRGPSGEIALALRGALEPYRHARTARGLLAVEQDRAVLVQVFDGEPTEDDLDLQSRGILRSLRTFLGQEAEVMVGVGGRRTALADAWISHDQARVAARAARRLPRLGGIGDWERLGEFTMFLQLPDSALNDSLVPKPLRRLLDDSAGSRLEETLRCFLENAGSVPRTAEVLELHRTSLYYRLRQIQEITGLDLDDGAHRLVLHMGLQLLDLLQAPRDGDLPGDRAATLG